MELPNNNEDVLVELENNIFAIAEYYDGYWEASEGTNPIDHEESFVLKSNVIAWYRIHENIIEKFKNSIIDLPHANEEVCVKLDNGKFAIALYNNDTWEPGQGTHASYRDIEPVLSGKVVGWINIEDILKKTKNLENNFLPEFNKNEYLKNLHTKQLLKLRDEIYKITPSEESKKLSRPCISSEEELYHYLNDSEVHYDVSNSFKNWYVTLNDVRSELKTREHIPNKAEAKEIRQQKAKKR